MKTKIYSLHDPDGSIRYIGKTIQELYERHGAHLYEARKGVTTHKCNWLRKCLSLGYIPYPKLIEEVEGNGSVEEIYWIKHYKEAGAKLVNGTEGGDGKTGVVVSAETRHKLSVAFKGRHLSEAHKEKVRRTQKGRKHTPEHVENHRQALIKRGVKLRAERELAKNASNGA